jgi:hypothetical protein
MADTRESQGFTPGWYAMPRWGDLRIPGFHPGLVCDAPLGRLRIIFTVANAMNGLILYTTEDGRSQIKLWAQEQTVWLTRLEMAELFDATKQNISLHLKNVFEDGELDEGSVVKESLTTAADGKDYSTKLYNLNGTKGQVLCRLQRRWRGDTGLSEPGYNGGGLVEYGLVGEAARGWARAAAA